MLQRKTFNTHLSMAGDLYGCAQNYSTPLCKSGILAKFTNWQLNEIIKSYKNNVNSSSKVTIVVFLFIYIFLFYFIHIFFNQMLNSTFNHNFTFKWFNSYLPLKTSGIDCNRLKIGLKVASDVKSGLTRSLLNCWLWLEH